MYNAFGGYIIYGVQEAGQNSFIPCGVERGSIDGETLRREIKKYTNCKSIAILYDELFVELDDCEFLFGVLFVPRRTDDNVARMSRNGPHDKRNRSIFYEGDVYVRKGDDCIKATIDDWKFLRSERANPWNSKTNQNIPRVLEIKNRPEKVLICPFFFGREALLEELWSWYDDALNHIKVLAGVGGQGKTSIAYEFVVQLEETPPRDLEYILWLTAKKEQYVALEGKRRQLIHDFSSYTELLIVLAREFGLPDETMDEYSETQLLIEIREFMAEIPALIVIDDVDSLDQEDQRKVMELGMVLSQAKAKTLLTTRRNTHFSSFVCLEVPGFDKREYMHYLQFAEHKHTIHFGKSSERNKLYDTTKGSPLVTDAAIRLLKLGRPISVVIRDIKDKDGEDVREFAFLRELEQLSIESKRTLLAAAYLGNCSQTELKLVTGYLKKPLEEYVEELRSLFLIGDKRITPCEPRFEVTDMVRALVDERAHDLAADPTSIRKRVEDLRSSSGKVGNRRVVGKAINQAMAQLRGEDVASAEETIRAALKKQTGHPDLMMTLGRCLMKRDIPDVDETRDLFRKAYQAGKRDSVLFDHWYEAEMSAKHPVGLLEVADMALKNKVGNRSNWLYKQSLGHAEQAKLYNISGEKERAIREYEASAELINEGMRQLSNTSWDRLRRQRTLEELHNAIWKLTKDMPRIQRAVDTMIAAWRRGDERDIVALNALEGLQQLVHRARKLGNNLVIEAAETRLSQFEGTFSRTEVWYARKMDENISLLRSQLSLSRRQGR